MLDQDDSSSSSSTDCDTSTSTSRDEVNGRGNTPASHRIRVTVKSDWTSSPRKNDFLKESERVGTPETDATSPTMGILDPQPSTWTIESALPEFSTPSGTPQSIVVENKSTASETSSSSMTSGSGLDEPASNTPRGSPSRPESTSGELRSNLFPESPDNDSFDDEFGLAHSIQFEDLPDRREYFPRAASDSVPQCIPGGDLSQWRLRSRRSISGSDLRHQSISSTVTLDLNYEECDDTDEFVISSRSRRGSKKVSRKYRRRRSSRHDSMLASQQASAPETLHKQCLRLAGSRLFPRIMVLCGFLSVSITFLAGHSMLVASELDALEHPKHMSVLYRQLDTDDSADAARKARALKKGLSKIKRVRSKQTPVALRGGVVHHETAADMGHTVQKDDAPKKPADMKKHSNPRKNSNVAVQEERVKATPTGTLKTHKVPHEHGHIATQSIARFAVPRHALSGVSAQFNVVDPELYRNVSEKRSEAQRRMVSIDSDTASMKTRTIELYPAKFTDNTQLYSILDSSDEKMTTMELRKPLSDGECVPMQEWQTSFYPSCNSIHELDLAKIGEDNGDDFNLFGTKGYWRNAWRVDTIGGHHSKEERDTTVLKTLKIEHRFEEAHFENDRVDAIAMERLTSSPHVINIFGYCGHSVVTEYADGTRLGQLAEKAEKEPLSRLRIARDIANGVADVHGIDGDGNATMVHFDVNPANVVTVKGTLKLNDFNIGILRRWNTTSNTPCGFPARYPNPQWRSPEEARDDQHLTEKVDIFSMGHIFFRLICGHEPWHKLEPGGRPSKEEVTEKVVKGTLPFIPEHVLNSSDPEVVAIRDAMLKCYTYDPTARPSAREIANFLQDTLLELENAKSSARVQ